MKNELSCRRSLPDGPTAATDLRSATDEGLAARADTSPVMAGTQGSEIGAAMRPIVAALALVSALFVTLASIAAPADAAAKTPFNAHGVFATCGQGEDRTTTYMTFLALRSERGFESMEALVEYAQLIGPRRTKLQLPGRDRARKLRPDAASLPEFLFIDSLETKGKPPAAGKGSAISWRGKRAGRRLRTPLRLYDVGKDFCVPDKAKGAGKERMLREAGLAAEDGRDSTRPTDRGYAKRQAEPSACSPGTYYGRTSLVKQDWENVQEPQGMNLSFTVDGDGRVSEIKEEWDRHYAGYPTGWSVSLPATTQIDSAGYFRAHKPEDGGGPNGEVYSPAADMSGQCSGRDRFEVTIVDRAGEHMVQVSRVSLEPGLYAGTYYSGESGATAADDDYEVRFRIYPEGQGYPECPSPDMARENKCRMSPPEFSTDEEFRPVGQHPMKWRIFSTPPGEGQQKQRFWPGYSPLEFVPRLAADGCHLGFTAYVFGRAGFFGFTGPSVDRYFLRWESATTCRSGNRVSGTLLAQHPDLDFERISRPAEFAYSWQATRVGD